jgi:hypothetical protein
LKVQTGAKAMSVNANENQKHDENDRDHLQVGGLGLDSATSDDRVDTGRRKLIVGAVALAGTAVVVGAALARRKSNGSSGSAESNAAANLVLTNDVTTTVAPPTTVGTTVGKGTTDPNEKVEVNEPTSSAVDRTTPLLPEAIDRSTDEPFAGLPVADFPATEPQSGVAVRLNVGWEDKVLFADLVKQLASSPNAAQVEALVIGAFDNDSLELPDSAIAEIVAAAPAFPKMKGLFFGDIAQERSEISWINCGNQATLAHAFPKLEILRIRGNGAGSLTNLTLPSLRSLTIETGGLQPQVVRNVLTADLPSLRKLSLWLGTPDYGGETTVADLAPLFEGRVHSGLTHLGLPNSAISDEVAEAFSRSPLIDTVEELDFSRGTIGDAGLAALTRMGPTPRLRALDISHHYAGPDALGALETEMRKRNVRIDTSDPQTEEDDERWVSISE